MNRASNGRFLPGHALAGPGRPTAAREQQFLAQLQDKLSGEVFAQVLDRLLALALGKRVAAAIRLKAIGLILQHTCPPPVQTLDIGGDSEFRVAGCTPAEIDATMWARVLAGIAARGKYEHLITTGCEPTNGHESN